MKRKIILICVLLIISIIVAGNYKSFKQDEKEYKVKESNIAIMVYDDESDSYIKQSSIPKGAKYSLNEELTKCEGGGTVTNYSKANGTLSYKLNEADQCYVYFDVDNTPSYAIYSETDNSLIFYKNNDIVGTEYNGRVVTAKYDDIEDSVYSFDSVNKVPNTPWYEYANVIKTVSVANEIMPISTAMWFRGLRYVESINLTNLNTSQVTTMERMFDNTAELSLAFSLNLGSEFDTSNVTNMNGLFQKLGFTATEFTLYLGSKFDTSKVTTMIAMFNKVGYSDSQFILDLGDKFDTSNVANMNQMFQGVGYMSAQFSLSLGDKFDTSKVIDMSYMFANFCHKSAYTCYLDLGANFDTSSVLNMKNMFAGFGYYSNDVNLELGYKFDTSKVTNMESMFQNSFGTDSNVVFNLGTNFDTSKVTNMKAMFLNFAASDYNFVLDMSKFVVKSNCDISSFFFGAHYKIIFGEGWANATLGSQMFYKDSSTPLEIVNAPANIQSYNFAADNRVVTFTTI